MFWMEGKDDETRLRAEFDAMNGCWSSVSKVDHETRVRVVQWLQSKIYAEAPPPTSPFSGDDMDGMSHGRGTQRQIRPSPTLRRV